MVWSQFLSIRYTERLAEAGIEGSVGSKGDSYDNALAESFNGLYKTELIYHEGPWKNADDVEWATLTYIEWSTTGCTARSAWSHRRSSATPDTVRSSLHDWSAHGQTSSMKPGAVQSIRPCLRTSARDSLPSAA